MSANDVMAATGAWLSRDEAMRMLDGLLSHIRARDIRFGLLRNQQGDVLDELEAVRAFLDGRPDAQKFNFALVA